MPIPGLHRLVAGRIAHLRVGKLALNLVSAPRLSNDDWIDFLEGTRRVSAGDQPTGSLSYFTGAFPDAAQRKLTVDWMAQNGVPELDRIALVTDSDVLRGALTAFNWLQPSVTTRAFSPAENGRALRWLRVMVDFDERQAQMAWRQAHEALGLVFPEKVRSGGRATDDSPSWVPSEPRPTIRRY